MADYVFTINWKRVIAYQKKSYIVDNKELTESEFLTLYKWTNQK